MRVGTDFRAPRRTLLWTEHARATAEAAALLPALPTLVRGDSGDGHRVLVLPGLLADDSSTIALRHVLRSRGYRTYAWRQGTNLGPTRSIQDGLLRRFNDLASRDGTPITLVGWSLGGLMARELARRFPDQVRGVVTLGSPIRITRSHRANATHASRIYHTLRPWHGDLLDSLDLPEEDRPALAMPASSIYSRSDGIVPWRACLDLPGPLRENIEVRASHLGMGANRQVISIVLDRLAQSPGSWRKYDGETESAA